MAVDRDRILGNALSYASWILKVKGHEWHGVKKIALGQKRERGKVWGTGRARRPRGRTGGKYTPTCKLTVYRGSMNDFIKFLSQFATDGTSYGNVEFDLIGQQVENGNETPTTIFVAGCLVADENFDDSDDSIDPNVDDIELDVMEIRRNGKTLYDNTRL